MGIVSTLGIHRHNIRAGIAKAIHLILTLQKGNQPLGILGAGILQVIALSVYGQPLVIDPILQTGKQLRCYLAHLA